jgi:hypothetical protein
VQLKAKEQLKSALDEMQKRHADRNGGLTIPSYFVRRAAIEVLEQKMMDELKTNFTHLRPGELHQVLDLLEEQQIEEDKAHRAQKEAAEAEYLKAHPLNSLGAAVVGRDHGRDYAGLPEGCEVPDDAIVPSQQPGETIRQTSEVNEVVAAVAKLEGAK